MSDRLETTTPTAPAALDRMLLLAVLGPPVVWAVRFGVVYVIIPYVCTSGWTWVLHAITAASLVIVGLMGLASWRLWRGEGSAATDTPAPPLAERPRFMAFVGALTGGFFLLVIAAEGLANFFIDPCLQSGVPIA